MANLHDQGWGDRVRSAQLEGDCAPISYAWDLDNDGVFEAEGMEVPFDSTAMIHGGHEVTLRVCEGSVCDTDTALVFIFWTF